MVVILISSFNTTTLCNCNKSIYSSFIHKVNRKTIQLFRKIQFATNASHFWPFFDLLVLHELLAPKHGLFEIVVLRRYLEGGRSQFAAVDERLHAVNCIFYVKPLALVAQSAQMNRRQLFQVRGGLYACFQFKFLHVQLKDLNQHYVGTIYSSI